MSNVYRGRAGPNVTAYLNNLNYEQDQFVTEDINFDDLAMFTNTNFTDFDIPSLPDTAAINFDLEDGSANGPVKYEELLVSTDSSDTFNAAPLVQPSIENNSFFANYVTPIQPAPPSNAFGQQESQLSLSSQSNTQSPVSGRNPEPGKSQAVSAEEDARFAAEEDKRRRNTAASARFRVKKKQREQALEKTVKEINDKNAKLEARISQLETENKWLKNLVTEKNRNQSKEDIEAAYLKFRKDSEDRELKAAE